MKARITISLFFSLLYNAVYCTETPYPLIGNASKIVTDLLDMPYNIYRKSFEAAMEDPSIRFTTDSNTPNSDLSGETCRIHFSDNAVKNRSGTPTFILSPYCLAGSKTYLFTFEDKSERLLSTPQSDSMLIGYVGYFSDSYALFFIYTRISDSDYSKLLTCILEHDITAYDYRYNSIKSSSVQFSAQVQGQAAQRTVLDAQASERETQLLALTTEKEQLESKVQELEVQLSTIAQALTDVLEITKKSSSPSKPKRRWVDRFKFW